MIVKGQCTLNMKNKVESLTGYDSIEASDDDIKLLNGLKELTFKMHEMQYGYWMICQTVRKVLTMRQQDNEPLAEYYKSFTSCVDVAESQWETLMPMTAATNETNEKMSRDESETLMLMTAAMNEKNEKMSTDKLETLVPMMAATSETNEKMFLKRQNQNLRFSCRSGDTKKYGKLKTKLNSRPNRIEWSG